MGIGGALACSDDPGMRHQRHEQEHENSHEWNPQELSKALEPLLHKSAQRNAQLKTSMQTGGFNPWRMLAFWLEVRSTNDYVTVDDDHESRETERSQSHDKETRCDAMVRDHAIMFDKISRTW